MSKSTTVTAVLCNYNGAAYLQEAIDSVLAQTRLPDEFIIVDDASTDGSKDLIRKTAQAHPGLIKFIEHPKQSGQAAGFNTAAKASTGSLLAFLDSDDLWFADKLERVEKVVATSSEFGLLQHNLQVLKGRVPTTESFIPAMIVGNAFEYWQRQYAFPNFAPSSGLIVPKSVFEKIRPIPESLRISADSFMTRASIFFGPVVSILDCLGAYRQHEKNNVAGNVQHDSWKFFLTNVSPRLAEFYQSKGSRLPIHIHSPQTSKASTGRKLLDGVLDLNLRRVLRKLRKA